MSAQLIFSAFFCFFSLTDDAEGDTLPHKPAKNASIHIEKSDESDASEIEDENEDPDDPYNLAAYDDEDDGGKVDYLRIDDIFCIKICNT